MQVAILKPQIAKKLKDNDALILKIKVMLGLSFDRVYKIISNNDPRLTQASILAEICTALDISVSEALTENPLNKVL